MHQNIKFLIVCMHFYNLFISSKALLGDQIRHVIPGEFRYIVSVSVRNLDPEGKFKHLCTSALVSRRDVLTAAHCLRDKSINEIYVIVGSPELKKGGHIPVLWWLTYDQWATTNNISLMYRHNDIAMIRMQKNVSSSIIPGKISALRNRHLVEHDIEISGWGRRDDNENSMILQTGVTRVRDPVDCKKKMKKRRGYEAYSSPIYFCSYSTPYVLAHKGDSGGPILYLSEIVGITIAVCPAPEEPLTPDKINVHLGTHFYRNFIFDVIENI